MGNDCYGSETNGDMVQRAERTYEHEDGRKCRWLPADGWVHGEPASIVVSTCRRTHDDAPEDRGSFGMPGLGIGHVISIPDHREPTMTIMHDGVDVNYGDQGYVVPAETLVAKRILRRHLPQAIEHFLKRNAEYGEDDDFNLGPAGQYVDISRKVQKLKRRWWDHMPARDDEESDALIVMELIGHLLMSLDMMEQQGGETTEG